MSLSVRREFRLCVSIDLCHSFSPSDLSLFYSRRKRPPPIPLHRKRITGTCPSRYSSTRNMIRVSGSLGCFTAAMRAKISTRFKANLISYRLLVVALTLTLANKRNAGKTPLRKRRLTYNEQDTKRYCVGMPSWGLSLRAEKSLANYLPEPTRNQPLVPLVPIRQQEKRTAPLCRWYQVIQNGKVVADTASEYEQVPNGMVVWQFLPRVEDNAAGIGKSAGKQED